MSKAIEKWIPLLDRFLGSTQVIIVTCKTQLEAKQLRASFYKARGQVYKDKELYAKYGEVLKTRTALLNKCDVTFEYTERRDVQTVLKEGMR
jgi:hypothetical protein